MSFNSISVVPASVFFTSLFKFRSVLAERLIRSSSSPAGKIVNGIFNYCF
ncbi:MAG: hypothetical protein R3A12_19685 [Ignavibacteria bacterium]